MKLWMFTLLLTVFPATASSDIITLGYDNDTFGYGYNPLSAGEAVAVRFTPEQAVVNIVGIRARIRAYSAACGENQFWILDDDGPEGSPGTTLYGPDRMTAPISWGWVQLDFEKSQVTTVEGEFYVAYIKTGTEGICADLGHSLGPGNGRYWEYKNKTWTWMGSSSPYQYNLRVLVEAEPVPTEKISWSRLKNRTVLRTTK